MNVGLHDRSLALALLAACGPGVDPVVSEETDASSSSSSTGEPSDTGSESTTGTSDVSDPDLPPIAPDVPAEPDCCGCLCGDPSWSCSAETCLDAEGLALELRAEAGFFELEEVLAVRDGFSYTAPRTRIWYSFSPADEQPEDKPLLVFFNGGPGSATTSGLFAMNVGPMRVDTNVSPAVVVDNPATWTAFANLLFLDARGTGFSYELGTSPHHYNADQDGADLLRVIMRFATRHPQLDASPIVIVGESYGGVRAVVMSHLLLQHDELADGVSPAGYRDPTLGDEIAAFGPERIAHFATIQGALMSFDQTSAAYEQLGLPSCPGDPYVCNEPNGDLDLRFEAAAQVLVQPDLLQAALEVDPKSIEWMYADARGEMIALEGTAPPDDAMREVFGELARGHYFIRWMYVGFNANYWREGSFAGARFLDAVRETDWFLTNAAQDTVVYMPWFPWVLDNDYTDTLESAVLDEDEPGDRPGSIVVRWLDGEERRIRFPPYAEAGHAVTQYAPNDIHHDMRDWLEQVLAP